LSLLRADSRAIFTAAAKAGEACNWLHEQHQLLQLKAIQNADNKEVSQEPRTPTESIAPRATTEVAALVETTGPNQAQTNPHHESTGGVSMSLRPNDKAGIVAAATLAAIAIGKPVYENRRDAWQKIIKEWHVEEHAATDAPANHVASPVESDDRAEIHEALSQPMETDTEEVPVMTELEKNRPLLELKCGRVQGSIWDREEPNGDIRYSLTLTRSWKDPEGNLHQLTNLDPEDLLYAKEVLAKAEQIFKEGLAQSVATEVNVTSPRYEEKKHRQKQSL
jgi:hypothetical protein